MAWLPYNESSPTQRAAAMPQLRFSLRSFFLFLFVACLIGSNVFTAWENRRLNEKLNQKDRIIDNLQVQVGQLVVTDPTKVHVVAIPTYEHLTWRWRVHVPDEGVTSLRQATLKIPESGIRMNRLIRALPVGESDVIVAVHKDIDDNWYLSTILARRSPAGPLGKQDQQTRPLKWTTVSPCWSTDQAGTNGTESMTPGEPMVLLRHRRYKRGAGSRFRADPEPCDGVLICIE